MTISKKEIQEALTALGGKPLFPGNDVYLLHDVTISTDKVGTLPDLIKVVFALGMRYKIHEVKNVLEITDPRS